MTRSRVEVSAAVSSLDRAQEERNKALVRRVYDEFFGLGNTDLVNELFSEYSHSTQPDAPQWETRFH